MNNLYNEVNTLLNSISFDDLWKGFEKLQFALYNKDKVYLENESIPYDHRFSSNTVINYEDKKLAIWYVENPNLEDPKLLASNLIKEMFHEFFLQNNHKTLHNNLMFLDYPDNMENYQVKFYENQLLAKAVEEKDINLKKSFLQEFFSLRASREKVIGEFITLEYLLETFEGLPEFIGFKALRKISEELFDERVKEYSKKISSVKKYFFNIHRISLYVGTLFFIALDELEIDFYKTIDIKEENFYKIIKNSFPLISPIKKIEYNDDLTTMYESNMKKNKKALSDFCNNKFNEIIGSYYISEYDSSTMMKIGDYILCNSFISLIHKITKENLLLKGPVVIKLAPNSLKEVVSYYA